MKAQRECVCLCVCVCVARWRHAQSGRLLPRISNMFFVTLSFSPGNRKTRSPERCEDVHNTDKKCAQHW